MGSTTAATAVPSALSSPPDTSLPRPRSLSSRLRPVSFPSLRPPRLSLLPRVPSSLLTRECLSFSSPSTPPPRLLSTTDRLDAPSLEADATEFTRLDVSSVELDTESSGELCVTLESSEESPEVSPTEAAPPPPALTLALAARALLLLTTAAANLSLRTKLPRPTTRWPSTNFAPWRQTKTKRLSESSNILHSPSRG